MNKYVMLSVLSCISGIFLAGCVGTPSTLNTWKETRALRENYQVAGSEVTGRAKIHNIMFWFWGDHGFNHAKRDAILQCPGADDLINMSTETETWLWLEPFYGWTGYAITGTPIKYTSNGISCGQTPIPPAPVTVPAQVVIPLQFAPVAPAAIQQPVQQQMPVQQPAPVQQQNPPAKQELNTNATTQTITSATAVPAAQAPRK